MIPQFDIGKVHESCRKRILDHKSDFWNKEYISCKSNHVQWSRVNTEPYTPHVVMYQGFTTCFTVTISSILFYLHSTRLLELKKKVMRKKVTWRAIGWKLPWNMQILRRGNANQLPGRKENRRNAPGRLCPKQTKIKQRNPNLSRPQPQGDICHTCLAFQDGVTL